MCNVKVMIQIVAYMKMLIVAAQIPPYRSISVISVDLTTIISGDSNKRNWMT